MNKTARLKKLSRHLLATTCLTVAATGVGLATTIDQSQAPGGRFSTSSTSPTILSSIEPLTNGANTATGNVDFGSSDDRAFFAFTDEVPGTSFTYSGLSNHNSDDSMEILNSSGGTIVTSFELTTTAAGGSGIVPSDGELIVGIIYGSCECGPSFNVTVTAPLAPEPSTFAELGLGFGLAGAVALRRRLKTRKA